MAKQLDDGQTTYLAGIAANGGAARDFTFAEDGTLLSSEVDLNDLSMEIQTAINTQVDSGKLENIEKTVDEVETDYDVTVIDPGGHEREFTISDAGTLVSKEVSLSELAPNIQAAINAQVGKGKLDAIDETFDEGTTAYDVSIIARAGKKNDLTISDQGILVSREVVLAELPPAVQDTITQTLGDGKVVRIDLTQDAKRKAYDVEGQKDGKPLNFTVGTKGKFLGMDD